MNIDVFVVIYLKIIGDKYLGNNSRSEQLNRFYYKKKKNYDRRDH